MVDESALTAMTYEKLFETLRAEKSKPGLQKLHPTFYEDTSEYLLHKQHIIEKSRSSTNVFAQKELLETTKQLENAKKILKMIYDLREKKVTTMALNKSRTASSLIDTSGLHDSEIILFKELVEKFEQFRLSILEETLKGNNKSKTTTKKTQHNPSTMQLVRFLDDVDAITKENVTIGPFEEEEVANIPTDVATQLLEKNKVQFLESS